MVELLAKWRRATAKLQDELGRPPTHEEIARSLDLPKKKLNIIKKAIRVYNSAPQTDQAETGWSLDEMLMDAHSKTPDTEMVEADDLHHVLDLLAKMDKREATVLRMRFGLDDEEPKTLKRSASAWVLRGNGSDRSKARHSANSAKACKPTESKHVADELSFRRPRQSTDRDTALTRRQSCC
jgi:hypothetical protein